MESIAFGSRDNTREADGRAYHPRSGAGGHSLISTDSQSKFQKTDGRAESGREHTENKTCAAPNPPAAEPVGGYAWEPYVSTRRVSEKLNCPPLVFVSESFDEFDAVEASVRRYQALYDQIANRDLNHQRIADAENMRSIASIATEREELHLARDEGAPFSLIGSSQGARVGSLRLRKGGRGLPSDQTSRAVW